MKTITFLTASVLMIVNFAKASEVVKITTEKTTARFNFNEPISFTERGIAFFVFPNGDFDFNTRPDDSHGTYQYKQAGRRSAVTEDANDENFGVLIERDCFGRIRRVGNTFINYDRRDRVNRIGSVFMNYNRNGLIQIGGMRIIYDYRGAIIDLIGEVKGCQNYGYAYSTYGPRNSYNYNNNGNYNDRDYATSYNNEDYYYYKADGTKTTVENDKKEERR